MIKHVVMWKFRPGTEEQAQKFVAGLKGLYGVIDVIKSCEVGFNCNPQEEYSACLVAEFENLADLNKYATDPRHLAVSAICKEIRESRVAVDFEI
ncbi:MAG: Dabb family protein [Succinivibrio sp.]|nr:Dabb family protein [Succinivibrio sp.]